MKYKIKKQYRLPGYDYSQDGWYYVTICTKNKEMLFGNIISYGYECFVELSEVGKIANKFWNEIPAHFPFVELDEYVIMPNHIHGIIQIDNYSNNLQSTRRNRALPCSFDGDGNKKIPYGDVGGLILPDGGVDVLPTRGNNEMPTRGNRAMPCSYIANADTVDNADIDNNTGHDYTGGSTFGYVTPKSISTIIGSFKSIVTITININFPNIGFAWQPRFHDRVIRTQKQLDIIRNYIINNPRKWWQDRNNVF